ncbi:uncharacterized protein DUF2877 [Lachnotalea glycerini]|uniref:Uncharacterized protein DUF2877 n=1 Tax=Lachnotalea glycerini TaxID=1763509 RepID=A0A318EQR1_9FIRM|nr:DUF2877 domain-containing protein [Lachnotalea glycerini]PXV93815.1 uncharacterized protein DUF2877 [Lachnotalea glycerini]
MKCNITDLSNYANAILRGNYDASIHSVYNKTINLIFGKKLLAIQVSRSPLSPISLITNITENELFSMHIDHSDQVNILSDGLKINSHFFVFKKAQIHDLELKTVLTTLELNNLKKQITTMISASENLGGFEAISNNSPLVEVTPILKVAKSHMNACLNLLNKQCYDDAAKEIVKLIGLGIGLTPSGDDFLCGLLAGMHLLKRTAASIAFEAAVQKKVYQSLKKTNDISAAFLEATLNNNYSYAVKMLTTNVSYQDIYQAFCSIGHSSGIDTLCGIQFVLDSFVK